MTEELKQQIIQAIESLHKTVGEKVRIDDWISTSSRAYDRHQTRYGRMLLEVERFYVRFSGSIATMGNDEQQIEFRTDAIKFITAADQLLILEIQMKKDVWRRIRIEKVVV